MSEKILLGKYDIVNNRILVRNSHKCVYKKLCNINRDEWCQKYLSVATSKLIDPKSTTKLPFSLNKRLKTQQNNPNSSLVNFMVKRKKSQVLAIHENDQMCKSSTIDNNYLIAASKNAQRLLQRMKKTVVRPNLFKRDKINGKVINKFNIRHRSKDQFQIQPWYVENNQDNQDKENKYF